MSDDERARLMQEAKSKLKSDELSKMMEEDAVKAVWEKVLSIMNPLPVEVEQEM